MLTVEDNWGDERILRVMMEKGYDLVTRLEYDLVFKRRDVRALPRTTVFCAVWHKDENRHGLLEGHAENLARQTVPSDSLYVFDGGDTPPSFLKERAIVVHGAWYVSDEIARHQGRLGRSEGCPALSEEAAPRVIQLIRDGTVLFSYYPSPALERSLNSN